MKRFYEKVETRKEEESGFVVLLDGRPIRTPAQSLLRLPTQRLAAEIAIEWEQQSEKIEPATMPLMRYAATALDRVSTQREAVIDEIAAFGGSDLLCHRAESPRDLVARQHSSWQPLLDWAADTFEATLTVTAGIMPVAQPSKALTGLRAAVARADDMALSGLHGITSIAGSLVLGLAVLDGRLDAETAWTSSQIDETFQAELWGEDEEAAARRTNLRIALLDAARFLALCDDQ